MFSADASALTPLSRRRVLVYGGAAVLATPRITFAQGRSIKIIVPFGPGNAIDSAARALAESLNRTTGKNYYVENRPGAGGLIGSAEASRAAPDGSVLLYTSGGHTTNAVLYKKLPYDSINDFTPISQVTGGSGFALIVGGRSPYQSLAQLIAAAKANPGKITYGSWGIGNTSHLIAELFARAANIDVVHVPYKTTPMTDLIAGQIDFAIPGISSAVPFVKDGRARVLAVNSSTRAPSVPDAPTFEESGLGKVEIPAWTGIWGPKGMPMAMAQSIQDEIVKAVQQSVFQDYLKLTGATAFVSRPDAFDASIRKIIPTLQMQLAPLNISMD